MRTTPDTDGAKTPIARMPRAIRDQVSACIVDGGTWKAVAKICAAAGYPDVNAQNVTNYRQGEHKRWLARQERMDAIRRDSEATAEIMRHYQEYGGSPAEAGLLASAEILSRALAGMGPEMLQGLMCEKPGQLFAATRELARVAETVAKLRPAQETKVEEKPVATPEDKERRTKEIFGIK